MEVSSPCGGVKVSHSISQVSSISQGMSRPLDTPPLVLWTNRGMVTSKTRTMATPTPAPITRFLRLSREAARVRKSSSPLAGMVVPARLNA